MKHIANCTYFLNTTAEKGTEHVIELLLKRKIQATNQTLITFCLRNDEILIETLINKGAESTSADDKKDLRFLSCLDQDCGNKISELLLNHASDEDKFSFFTNKNVLSWSIMDKNCTLDIVEELLQWGAYPLYLFSCDWGYYWGHFHHFLCKLPIPKIEQIIKYTSLQVINDGDKEINGFLSYLDCEDKKEIKNFALKCLKEAESLKLFLIDQETTLFDFVVSSKNTDALKAFLNDTIIVNQIFELLSKYMLPIYSQVIVKKFEDQTIINKIVKLYVVSQSKKVYLNSCCIEYICTFLAKEDIKNFFLAFTSHSIHSWK